MIHFSVDKQPLPQKRHRDRKGGGKYDPSKAEKKYFLTLARAFEPDEPFDFDLRVTLVFYGKDLTGDIDNYIKFVFDALNKVFWLDDRFIKEVRAEMIESKSMEKTFITIEDKCCCK